MHQLGMKTSISYAKDFFSIFGSLENTECNCWQVQRQFIISKKFIKFAKKSQSFNYTSSITSLCYNKDYLKQVKWESSFNKGSLSSKGFTILISSALFALNFLQNSHICSSCRWFRLERSGNFEFARNFVKI